MPDESTQVVVTEDMVPIAPSEFTEGFQETPLQEFVAVARSFEVIPPREGSTYKTSYIAINFTDMRVIRSQAPVLTPMVQLQWPISKGKTTRWGIFANSMTNICPLPKDPATGADVRFGTYMALCVVNKTIHITKTAGHMLFNGKTKKQEPTEVFEVVELDGKSAPKTGETVGPVKDGETALIDLMDGKTMAQWEPQSMDIKEVSGDKTLMSKVLKRVITNELALAGKIQVDSDGVYHKK